MERLVKSLKKGYTEWHRGLRQAQACTEEHREKIKATEYYLSVALCVFSGFGFAELAIARFLCESS